jgi:hypothetical protein
VRGALTLPDDVNERSAPRPQLASARRLGVPLIFIAALATLAGVASIRHNSHLTWSVAGAAALLTAWTGLLSIALRRTGRTLTLEVSARKQHVIQACAQGSVFLYWGWFWRPVYDAAPLIVAQLLFAYAFDMLLSWSRRDRYTLGFGPFPVIFSINLFLWFKPDWFYLQFAMIALGFLAKEFIHWHEQGHRAGHVFNPSAFPLAVFSLGLIFLGMSDTTRGQDIAITQFYPPHIYLALFLIGLPGQFFFGVTAMTMSAVVTTYLFGLIYFAVTGVYFFYDSFIPIAVFLGMHLLFTDPTTSPRTELGRIVFGALYGLSSIALYQLLGAAGLPTFYDKLLQVPLLNLSARSLDRLARSRWLEPFNPARLGLWLAPRQRHLAYMSVWAIAFAVMASTQGVGDQHPGQWLPFWQKACRDGRDHACDYLVNLQSIYCNAGSGWSCNETGRLLGASIESGATARAGTAAAFERACRLGFEPGCRNLEAARTGTGAWLDGPPTLGDYPIILRGSKGPIEERDPAALYARACAQGWPDACGRADPVAGE